MADKIDNLVPQAHILTVDEQSKGGKKSAEVRRNKRDLKRAFDVLLEKEYKDANGSIKTGAELLALKQFQNALAGDVRAFELVRDTAGQMPIKKIAVQDIDPDVIDEVENIVLQQG